MNSALGLVEDVFAKPDHSASLHLDLQKAFEIFSVASQELTESHRVLENRLVNLQEQFSVVDLERQQELAHKNEIKEQFSQLLQVLPVGVVVLDRQGLVTQSNPAADELLGLCQVGMKWLDIISRSFAPQANDGHEISLKDGRLVSVITTSLSDARGQLIVIVDMTETRKLQSRIERNRRIWELGKMSAALAHQVRTPLSSAMLYASQLKNSALSQAAKDQFCDRLLGSLHHLESQIKNILSIAKPETQGWKMVPVSDLMKHLRNSVEAILLQRNAVLNIEVECDQEVVRCHQDSLQGALTNLVENGIESAGSDPKVVVRCQKKENTLEIVVIDNGVGIPEQEQEKIFDPFYTNKTNGTGLGLSVVKKVVDNHGGHIHVESELGKGSVFTITL